MLSGAWIPRSVTSRFPRLFFVGALGSTSMTGPQPSPCCFSFFFSFLFLLWWSLFAVSAFRRRQGLGVRPVRGTGRSAGVLSSQVGHGRPIPQDHGHGGTCSASGAHEICPGSVDVLVAVSWSFLSRASTGGGGSRIQLLGFVFGG